MSAFRTTLTVLYLLCAVGIVAGVWWSPAAPFAPWFLAGKLTALLAAATVEIVRARRRWLWPILLLLALAGAAAAFPLPALLAGAFLVAALALWRAALSRKASVALAVTTYGIALLGLLLPRLEPGPRFNLIMILFIVVFIVAAAVIASLFTWLFLKVFEALDRSFATSFLYLLPLLAAPAYLLSRVILPNLATPPESAFYAAPALALDGVLLAGLLLLLVARVLGQRLGPRHFVPLVAWKLLRSQRIVLTPRSRRLQQLRELVPLGTRLERWPVLAEIAAAALLGAALYHLAAWAVSSATWLALWRGVAAILVATWLAGRSLVRQGRPSLLLMSAAVVAALTALYTLWRGQFAGDSSLPPWLAPAAGLVPLLLLTIQGFMRGELARRRARKSLSPRLDPKLAPMVETRIREGVGASVFVSVVGVAIGVWALIVVLSVMGGFSGEMQSRIVRTKDHLMIKATDRDAGLATPLELARRVAEVEGVETASAYIEAEAMMSSASNISATVTVRGLDRSPDALGFLTSSLVGGSIDLFAHPEDLVGYPDLSPLPFLNDSNGVWSSAAATPMGLESMPGIEPMQGEADDPLVPAMPELEGLSPPDEGGLSPLETAGLSPNENEAGSGSEEDLPELADAPGLVAMPAIGDEPAPDLREPSPYQAGTNQHVLPAVIIGQELARSLGAGVGSRITVISPDGDIGPMGVQPKARAFRVAAIFSTGMYEYDLKLAYMYLPDARRFFNLTEAIDHIDVRLQDLHAADEIRTRLEPVLSGYQAEVLTWQEMNRNLFSALKLERVVMFIVLGFIILIASFNIVASLIIIIRKRLAAIAILRTLGAGSREVTRIFFLLGGAAGLFGIASGVMMGLSSCGIIEHLGLTLPREYYIRSLPVAVDGWQVTQIALAALAMTALAARYPGHLAARTHLVEGLKDER